jgi:uncharacterized repeat protein (TIGR03803 family)
MSRNRGLWSVITILLTAALMCLPALPGIRPASKFKTVQVLPGYTYAGLVLDASGNLYGTTFDGGTYGRGTVFVLTRGSNGRWTEHVLHDFEGGNDGEAPYASPIFDAAGNLYGTTRYGGASGNGTVFELRPDSKGKWTERVLYQFTGGKDGGQPWSGVIIDAKGNLYGTTSGGGNSSDCAYSSCGVVFELKRTSNGDWKEQVLHAFNGKDGGSPLASLVFDGDGSLYGTTEWDSVFSGGTAFELAHGSDGEWTEHVLHRFSRGTDGGNPAAGLVLSAAGDLYGTTEFGGDLGGCGGGGCGVVFELTYTSNGQWTEHVLHAFTGGADGSDPRAGVIFDLAGDLYGTASEGASSNGTVFELSRNSKVKWTAHVLHQFGIGKGPGNPNAGLIFDEASNLYGTTLDYYSYRAGTVFKLTLNSGDQRTAISREVR